ncbi:MAG: FIST C-terminal domain-containing protein [Coriobacteriales bacterium]|jgi:hypothetical protein|nr:FIST C-terminal domain-containing protein [Coriobacteriales bacterium]
MRSATALSFELDDVKLAASELAASIKEKLSLEPNAVGILLCDADADGAAVSAELERLLGIDIAGMATLATLDATGHHEGALVLLVLTASDVRFTTAVSEPFSQDYSEQIVAAYRSLIPGRVAGGEPGSRPAGEGSGEVSDEASEESPALLLAFCPSGVPFSGDSFPDALAEVSGGAPIIGGVTSDDYDYERARVFLHGTEYKQSLVLVGLWGRVRPAFSIRHVTSEFAERIRRVSEVEGNIVSRVGDESFVDYLRGFGLDVEVEDPTLSFVSFPMQLTREEVDETPLLRHIAALDLATGTGTFLGDVPENSLANICLINRDDLKVSARESMEGLLETMQQSPDYEYSTVLCISCCGRAIIMGTESDAEGTILEELLPDGLTLAGAYCLGEICPTRYVDGRATNRFHNCSFTLCAL